jgi:hypothetical protein
MTVPVSEEVSSPAVILLLAHEAQEDADQIMDGRVE